MWTAVANADLFLAIEGARDLRLLLLKRMGFARGTPRDTGTYLPEGI
jgi:hypothetical protein